MLVIDNAGYFPTTFWGSNFWTNGYWGDTRSSVPQVSIGGCACRLNDIWDGKCVCGHGKMSGPVINGSPDVFINSLPAARITDATKGNCNHIGSISSGSPNVFINSLNSARIGDSTKKCTEGKLITGSPNVNVN